MSGHLLWSFRSIFDIIDPDIPTIHLTECEIYILWTLGEEGPMSIYALAKRSRFLPKISPVLEPDPSIWNSKMEENKGHDYHSVHTKVRELLRQGLIQKQPVLKAKRRKPGRKKQIPKNQEPEEGIGLTFLGLMFYFQNLEKFYGSSDEELGHVLNKCKMLIPLPEQLNLLSEDLKERCKRAFAKTVKEFVDIQNVELRVPSASLVFDGFLKRNTPTNSAEVETKVVRERDNEMARCLEKKEMSTLRDCYIAYLAVKDIYQLPEETAEDVRFFEGLESEKELAYLEGRNINADLLFKGNRLREFLPKYAGIEYFFTGMFVENLLWNEKPARKAKEETRTPDFEVEFY
jgi:hypothetical protein